MEQIQYELKYADFLEVTKSMMNNNPSHRLSRILYFFFAVLPSLSILKNPTNFIHWFFLCFFLALAFYPNVIWPLKARKSYQQQKDLHGAATISFDDGTIIFKSQTHETSLRWIFKFYVTQNALFIFPTPCSYFAHIIFKKHCKDEDQFNRLVNLVKKLKEFNVQEANFAVATQ